jgi:hypothetical protein
MLLTNVSMKAIEIILTCVAAILAGLVTYKWKSLDTLGKITLITIIIAAILIAINSYRQSKKDSLIEKINAKFGDIKDIDGAIFPKMAVGNKNAGAFYYSSNNVGVFDIEPVGPLIKIYVLNNRLFVNVIVRDLYGKAIAVIEDNTWTIFDNDFEYNNDNTAFELVSKGERIVYFQIELSNGIAYISGYLLNNKGFGFAFFNLPGGVNKSLALVVKPDLNSTRIPQNLNIPRIFKYPRGKYYRVRL